MPRNPRASQGGYCYHVLNRGNGRRTIFHKDSDFAAFVKLLRQAGARTSVRLLAYCLMPNHFHLTLWPRADGDLSDYMRWLLTAHGDEHRDIQRIHRIPRMSRLLPRLLAGIFPEVMKECARVPGVPKEGHAGPGGFRGWPADRCRA